MQPDYSVRITLPSDGIPVSEDSSVLQIEGCVDAVESRWLDGLFSDSMTAFSEGAGKKMVWSALF